MQISLRKAAALQNEIRAAIKELPLTGTVTVTQYTQDVDQAINTGRDTASETISRRGALNAVLYNIRAAVSSANDASGVSGALAEINRLDQVINDLSTIVKFPATAPLAEVNARLDKQRNAKDDTYSFHYDRMGGVEVGVFDEDTLAGFRNDLAAAKRKRQTLKDKILELNIRQEITLSDQDVEILGNAGLV